MIKSRGVTESEKAWRQAGRRVPALQRLEMLGFHKGSVRDGRRRLSGRADGYRMKRVPGAYGVDVRARGRARARMVTYIEPTGAMVAAEFGAKKQMVYGKYIPQSELGRRTAKRWERKGSMIGPNFEAQKTRKQNRELADATHREVKRNLNRYGVPK